jgi:hypothetical protein
MELQFHPDPAHAGSLTAYEKDQDGWNFSSILILLIQVR